jgi:hypothetical protein
MSALNKFILTVLFLVLAICVSIHGVLRDKAEARLIEVNQLYGQTIVVKDLLMSEMPKGYFEFFVRDKDNVQIRLTRTQFVTTSPGDVLQKDCVDTELYLKCYNLDESEVIYKELSSSGINLIIIAIGLCVGGMMVLWHSIVSDSNEIGNALLTKTQLGKRIEYVPPHQHILSVIKAIRESHPDMVYLYTQGQCYNFHLILKQIYINETYVVPYYSIREGHVYSKIGLHFYDIKGRAAIVPEDLTELEELGLSDAPENWGARDKRRLIELQPA